MYIKIHKTYREVVALCDKELVGKVFEENQKQLEIKESFYKGEEKTAKELILILQDLKKEDATFNIVGKKATQTAIQAGIISEKAVGKISNIPYALILL